MALPFTLFIYESAEQLALRTDATAAGANYWKHYDRVGKDMAAAGILRGGSALMTTEPIATVRDGAVQISSRPFAPSSHALGGYFQIEVDSAEVAAAWAKRLPAEGGAVEVRPGFPVPASMGMQ